MRASIIAAVLGVVLLGITWAPTVFNGVLDKVLPNNNVVNVNTDLSKLVPSNYRVAYGCFFRDMAVGVKEVTSVQTTDQLLAGGQTAIKIFKATEKMPDLPDFGKVVDERLTTAMGKKSEPLTDDTRSKFAQACSSITADLGVK